MPHRSAPWRTSAGWTPPRSRCRGSSSSRERRAQVLFIYTARPEFRAPWAVRAARAHQSGLPPAPTETSSQQKSMCATRSRKSVVAVTGRTPIESAIAEEARCRRSDVLPTSRAGSATTALRADRRERGNPRAPSLPSHNVARLVSGGTPASSHHRLLFEPPPSRFRARGPIPQA